MRKYNIITSSVEGVSILDFGMVNFFQNFIHTLYKLFYKNLEQLWEIITIDYYYMYIFHNLFVVWSFNFNYQYELKFKINFSNNNYTL